MYTHLTIFQSKINLFMSKIRSLIFYSDIFLLVLQKKKRNNKKKNKTNNKTKHYYRFVSISGMLRVIFIDSNMRKMNQSVEWFTQFLHREK